MVLTEKSLASERRRYSRFNIDLPVKYNRKANLSLKYGKYGRAVNASEGGLLVHFPEETWIGQNLTLQLFFPLHSDLNILETSARVVWTSMHVRKDLAWDYRTGLSFVDLSQENMTKFKNYLMNFSQKAPSFS
jgi:c-di-GMP-binding flagellar brake protein YcgR